MEMRELVSESMEQTVSPIKGLSGECDLPGHPELSMMALALSAKAEGTSIIRRCSRRPEVKTLAGYLAQIGITVGWEAEEARVTGGVLQASNGAFDVGRSEVLFGCLAGLAAGADLRLTFEGSPAAETGVKPVLEALQSFGARFTPSFESVFPVESGGSKPRPGSFGAGRPSAAVKTAVFLATLDVGGEIELLQEAAGEEDLEVLLKAAGGDLRKARVQGGEGYRLVLRGPVSVQATEQDLPGDPDAALFLLFAASMHKTSDVTLLGVGNDWKTRRLLDLLRRMNAQIEIKVTRSASGFSTRIVRATGSELRRTKISGEQSSLFMDEIPVLAVMGARAAGETVIRDARALRDGPNDCLALMAENLRKMQVRVGEITDGLVVQGGRTLRGADVDGGGDSRVTLALTLAGLVAEGETKIKNPGPVDRDYPGVLDRLLSLSEKRGE